jgi:hypothetical protein
MISRVFRSVVLLTLVVALLSCGGGGASMGSVVPGGSPIAGVTIQGRLIWHSYDQYGFVGVRSWMADFTAGQVLEITPVRVSGAMNYHFSPDGSLVVFMGNDATASAAHAGSTAWDIWIAQVGASGLQNVTRLTNGQADGSRNEDPRFSPDGTHIVFKRNLTSLVSVALSGVQANGTDQLPAQTLLLSGSTETSMPSVMPAGGGVLFANGSSLDSIRLLSGGTVSTLYALGTHDYYPVALDATRFYFVSGQTGGNDWILRGDLSASLPVPAAFITPGLAGYEFADPEPMGGNWLAYASTAPGGNGAYDIWIGNASTGQTANVSAWIGGANHANSDLGPSFFGTISP